LQRVKKRIARFQRANVVSFRADQVRPDDRPDKLDANPSLINRLTSLPRCFVKQDGCGYTHIQTFNLSVHWNPDNRIGGRYFRGR